MKCALSYWLAAQQHILCTHSALDGNGTSSQHTCTHTMQILASYTMHKHMYTMHWPCPKAPPFPQGRGLRDEAYHVQAYIYLITKNPHTHTHRHTHTHAHTFTKSEHTHTHTYMHTPADQRDLIPSRFHN